MPRRGSWSFARIPNSATPAGPWNWPGKAPRWRRTTAACKTPSAWRITARGTGKEAVAALEESMRLGNGGDCSDWFFLAMAHWKLDRKAEARKWYETAVAWMDKHHSESEWFRRFRAEAEELLEIKPRKD